MKSILPITFAVAFASFLALPFNAELTGSLSFAAGIALVLGADYGRRARTLISQPVRRGTRESLRLAA